MNHEVYYAVAGALAALLRALGASQDTLSRKTLIDVILGAASGVLVPLFVVPMKPEWSILAQACIVLGSGYLSGSLLSIIVGKVLPPSAGNAILGPVESIKAKAAEEARAEVGAALTGQAPPTRRP